MKKETSKKSPYIYRIYGNGLHGYEMIDITSDEKQIDDYRGLTDYSKLLVIRHNIKQNQDEVFIFEDLQEDIKQPNKQKKLRV